MSPHGPDPVDEAEAGSFPASDPPGWTLGAPADHHATGGVREVVGVFPSTASLDAVVAALQSSGVDQAQLSVLASGPEAEERLRSAGFHRVQDLLDSADAPRADLLDPSDEAAARSAIVSGLLYVGAALGAGAVVAAGAVATVPLMAAMAGSGALGGTLGGFLAHRLGAGRARYAEAHLAHGGLVLWVRVGTGEEERVARLMRKHGGTEVHAHGPTDTSQSQTSGDRS